MRFPWSQSKLLPPNNKSVASVARDEGVAGHENFNRQTLIGHP